MSKILWKGFVCVVAWSLAICVSAQVPLRDIAVEKTVDNAYPTGPGQTVQFTITAENVGSGGVAGATIRDKLPDGLALPQVMSPAASAGRYSAESGDWILPGLPPGAKETLVIPAVPLEEVLPPCIVNRAELLTDDDNNFNDSAAVAIHGQGVERCVDLEVSWSKPIAFTHPCGGRATVEYDIYVKNLGPEDAHQVSLRVAEVSSFKLPGFAMESSRCSGNVCTWETIQAGHIHSLSARSRSFKNGQTREHILRLEVSTPDQDYHPENDVNSRPRTISSFAGACPDYGVPDPYLGAGGGGGGCFIATAAYGTDMDSRIDLLRRFRDRWLLTNSAGQSLVELYYHHSPPLADYIATRPMLRASVRGLLVPVLLLVEYPAISLASIALLLIALAWWYRSRGRSTKL